MIGLDTNVLTRYYIDDKADAKAQRQRVAARRLDALHHASYKSCDSVASFDDRKFAQRAKKLGLAPAVMVVQ